MIGALTRTGTSHWVVVHAYHGSGRDFRPSDFMVLDPGSANRRTLSRFFEDYPRYYKIAYITE